jgi:hypothetical protein
MIRGGPLVLDSPIERQRSLMRIAHIKDSIRHRQAGTCAKLGEWEVHGIFPAYPVKEWQWNSKIITRSWA